MAKALLGHVGGPDPRIMSEMKRLQRRIRDLESELGRVRAENDSLSAALHEGPLLTFDDVRTREPALT
jgi:hypothetical protein